MVRRSLCGLGFVLALLLVIGACSSLPDIPRGVCGNGVLEQGEDCDGFARDGLACRAPGSIGQCHLDCSPDMDGERTRCLSGWGCDPANVCRRATGEFRARPDPIVGNAWSLASGDFDGDGRDDVLSTEPATAFGLTKLRVHYVDRMGPQHRTWTLNDIVSTPLPLRLPGDARSDVVYSRGGGIGLRSGEPDGSLITDAMASYYVPNTELRIIPVDPRRIRDSTALLVLGTFNGESGLFRQSRSSTRIELAIPLQGGPEALAAEPVPANLFEDDVEFPCDEIVLAYRGASEVGLYSTCELDPFSGALDWREPAAIINVPLEPSDRLSQGLVVADLDADGHLDLLVGAEHGTYVAYGDGHGFTSLQLAPLFGDDGEPLPMPIAAGDLNGDGRADVVLPDGVLFSTAPSDPRELHYARAINKFFGAAWTEAVIADFNRDGSPDLAAASRQGLDIDFLNGTSSESLNPFAIATDRPVTHLAVGDLDGDRVNDLAFVQQAPSANEPDPISIAFGDLAGAPSSVVITARLHAVQQIGVMRSGTGEAVWNLGTVYGQDDPQAGPGSAVAFFPGNSDRTLPCAVELTNFQEDGTLATASTLTLNVGQFVEPGRRDVVVLAVADSLTSGHYELWLVPDLDERRGTSQRLGWGFPKDLQPLLDRDGTPWLAAVLAAGDLDRDGLDEVVLAAPDGTGTRCLITSAAITPDEITRVHPESPVVLEDTCTEQTQLAVVDLDGDGAQDVVMLVGADGGHGRLMVLWGDGTLALDASRLDDLTPAGEQPRAFAAFRPSAEAPLQLAYVTDTAVAVLQAGKNARSFRAGEPIAALEHGTGIVAADIDGDGVTDLAVADAGAVRVLLAQLEAP